MKCSASQTTSSAVNASQSNPLSAADAARLHQVATQFESLLVNIALRPMTDKLGPMGTIVGQQLSLKIAASMSDPLYEQLRSEIG